MQQPATINPLRSSPIGATSGGHPAPAGVSNATTAGYTLVFHRLTAYLLDANCVAYATCCHTQAGGDGGQLVSVVPAGLTRLFQHPTLDWNLFSTNQQALTDREVGVGGCCCQWMWTQPRQQQQQGPTVCQHARTGCRVSRQAGWPLRQQQPCFTIIISTLQLACSNGACARCADRLAPVFPAAVSMQQGGPVDGVLTPCD